MSLSTPHLSRTLAFDALANARDLGGHRARAGLTVRRRRVLRGDSLHRASAADLLTLDELGLRTVIDLRTVTEAAETVHPYEQDPYVAYYRFPLLVRTWAEDGLLPDGDPTRFLTERYLDMLERGTPALAAALDVLADPDAHPVLVHCSVGKDRTGVLAAVLLATLGVGDEAIVEDYVASGPSVARLVGRLVADDPDIAAAVARQPAAYLDAPHGAMAGFLAEVRRRHGTMVGFVRSIGVPLETVERLHHTLLH